MLRLADAEATDAVAFLLGLSDRQLHQMGEYWLRIEEKTRTDSEFHTFSAHPAPGGGGFTILCGRGMEDEFQIETRIATQMQEEQLAR